jgi:hypothetical protein
MDPDLKEYITFRIRYNAYKCKVLINYLNEFYIAYLNDILIYFKDPLKYIKQVYKVLSRF